MAAHDWLTKDLYTVLGVPDDSTDDALKQAYRRLVRQHHPDTNAGCRQAERRFKEVGAAYAVLSNRVRRTQYDRTRHRLNTSQRAPRTRPGSTRPSTARPENSRTSGAGSPGPGAPGPAAPDAGSPDAAGSGPARTAPHAGWAPLLWAPAVWSTTLWSGMAQATAASSLWWAPQRSSSTG